MDNAGRTEEKTDNLTGAEESTLNTARAEKKQVVSRIIDNIEKVIVGKDKQIELLMVALLTGGHVLLEDVPGTGKTKTARSLAQSLSLRFKRVQFTIDLLPSDLTGIHYFDRKADQFVFREGPIFTNILLADEINRATARTQSALLECMEEKQVTVDGETRKLPPPFLVIATQNPIESQGTFPLPEAQLDRFLLMLSMDYPTLDESIEILKRFAGKDPLMTLKPVADPTEILAMQEEVNKIYVSDLLYKYAADIVEATRHCPEIRVGASPRALLALVAAARALAFLRGRTHCVPEDLKELAVPVLAHRLTLQSSGSTSRNANGTFVSRHEYASSVVRNILDSVPCPTEDFDHT
ncbi:MAG: AAA family ATPase [Clostridiales bacterium]|nr:AAA family ATPase [Clostridiales bacterium]